MTPEELEADADAIAAWEKAVGWTAPECGIPGSGISPFQLDGASEEWLNALIDESPDVCATRVRIGGNWMKIHSGHHPDHGSFTILMAESEHEGYYDEAYIINNGCVLADNMNFWHQGEVSRGQMSLNNSTRNELVQILEPEEKSFSPEEIDELLGEISQMEDGTDTVAGRYTAPEEGIPGSDTPPFQLGGMSAETVEMLINESPDVRATRLLVGVTDVWVRIYSGNHPGYGLFTIFMEEDLDSYYVVHKRHLLKDDPDFWSHGNFHEL